LYILGAGPLEENLRKQVNDSKLENIEFLGYKTGKELEYIIRNSKFVVLPSELYENCPMSVIEAMAYGKAVVGSNIGGIPELIEDEITGLIFNAGDEIDLANKINCLINNPEKSVNMGKEGRLRAEKLYDKDKHYEKIDEIYKSILQHE